MPKITVREVSTALAESVRIFRDLLPDKLQVAAATERLRALHSNLIEDALESTSVEEGEMQELRMHALELGAALADWGGCVRGVDTPSSWQAAEQQFVLAMHAVGVSCLLQEASGWDRAPGNLFRWARCAGAALGGGRELLLSLLETTGGAFSSLGPGGSQRLLGIGAGMVGHQLQMVFDVAMAATADERTEAAFASTVAAPASVCSWIAVAAVVLRVAKEAGVECKREIVRCAAVASNFVSWRASKAYSRHQAALAPQQQAALVALLPDALAAMHQALDLCGVSSDASAGTTAALAKAADTWLVATKLLQLLPVPGCKPGQSVQLGTHDVAKIVPAGFQLFLRVPRQRPTWLDGRGYSELLAAAAAACGQLLDIQVAGNLGPGSEVLEPLTGMGPPRVMPIIARMAAALLQQAEETAAEEAAGTAAAVQAAGASGAVNQASMSSILDTFAHGASQVAGQAEVSLLVESESTCAFWLERLDSTQAALQLLRFALVAPGPAGVSLAARCLRVASSWDNCMLAVDQDAGAEAARQQVAQRLLTTAAAACSLVHALAACNEVQLEILPPSWPGDLLDCLNPMFASLSLVSDATVPPRQLQAVHAAALSATSVVLGCFESAAGPRPCTSNIARRTLRRMVEGLRACPALLHISGVQPALETVARSFLQVTEGRLADLADCSMPLMEGFRMLELQELRGMLASMTTASPGLAAWLASTGLLRSMAEGCLVTFPAAGSASSGQEEDAHAAATKAQNLAHVAGLVGDLHAAVATLAQAAQQAKQEGGPAITAPVAAAAAQAAAFEVPQLPAEPAAARAAAHAAAQQLLLWAEQLAEALQAHWRQPEHLMAAALEVARVCVTRGCANLRCPNLGAAAGNAPLELGAGQVPGSKRCGGCRVAFYCGTACSHADWREGHRRVCKALAAERAAEKARQREQPE